MQPRTLIVFVLALIMAGATAMGIRGRLNEVPAEQQAVPTMTKVLAATVEIPAGTFVHAERHLKWMDVPNDRVEPGYVTDRNGSTPQEFNGAVARRVIRAGEPINSATLVRSGDGGFMSAVLNPGMRAVSIAVDATSGNAGFIFPGDKVDLLVTHTISPAQSGGEGGSQARVVSQTFIEDVRVLAIDQMLDNPENKAVVARTVTLEVSPKQAEKINVATLLGRISLALRSLNAEEKAAKNQDEPTSEKPVEEQTAEPIDPFLLEPLTAQPTQTAPGEHLTRDSDVSSLLQRRGAASGPVVQIIRGSEATTLQFPEKP